MKASSALNKSSIFRAKINKLIEPINKRLEEILEDDSAHITYQHGDGWCICHDDQKNAAISFFDIDKLLKMNKTDALKQLEKAAI